MCCQFHFAEWSSSQLRSQLEWPNNSYFLILLSLVPLVPLIGGWGSFVSWHLWRCMSLCSIYHERTMKSIMLHSTIRAGRVKYIRWTHGDVWVWCTCIYHERIKVHYVALEMCRVKYTRIIIWNRETHTHTHRCSIKQLPSIHGNRLELCTSLKFRLPLDIQQT